MSDIVVETKRRAILESSLSDLSKALQLANDFVEQNSNEAAAWSIRSYVLWSMDRRNEADELFRGGREIGARLQRLHLRGVKRQKLDAVEGDGAASPRNV